MGVCLHENYNNLDPYLWNQEKLHVMGMVVKPTKQRVGYYIFFYLGTPFRTLHAPVTEKEWLAEAK